MGFQLPLLNTGLKRARNDNRGIQVIYYQKANLISNQTPAIKKRFPTNSSFPLWILISKVSQGLEVRCQTILLIDNKSLPVFCSNNKNKWKVHLWCCSFIILKLFFRILYYFLSLFISKCYCLADKILGLFYVPIFPASRFSQRY